MEVNNEISRTMDATAANPRLDDACRNLLAFKIFLAHIIKACIEFFKDFSAEEISEKYIEGNVKVGKTAVHQDEIDNDNEKETNDDIIEGKSTEDNSVKEKTLKYDILFNVTMPETEEVAEVIVNIEIQNDFYPKYHLLKRGIYYTSRLLSFQHKKSAKGENYNALKKVYSIWVCPNPPDNKANTMTKFCMEQKNIIGNAKYDKKDYDLMEVVMICLGDNTKDANHKDIIKMLGTLFSLDIDVKEKKKILLNEFGIKMTKKIEDEVINMCNFSTGVYMKGVKKGREEGIKKGREEGREEGIKKAEIENATNFLKNGVDIEIIVKSMPNLARSVIEDLAKNLGISTSNA